MTVSSVSEDVGSLELSFIADGNARSINEIKNLFIAKNKKKIKKQRYKQHQKSGIQPQMSWILKTKQRKDNVIFPTERILPLC